MGMTGSTPLHNNTKFSFNDHRQLGQGHRCFNRHHDMLGCTALLNHSIYIQSSCGLIGTTRSRIHAHSDEPVTMTLFQLNSFQDQLEYMQPLKGLLAGMIAKPPISYRFLDGHYSVLTIKYSPITTSSQHKILRYFIQPAIL